MWKVFLHNFSFWLFDLFMTKLGYFEMASCASNAENLYDFIYRILDFITGETEPDFVNILSFVADLSYTIEKEFNDCTGSKTFAEFWDSLIVDLSFIIKEPLGFLADFGEGILCAGVGNIIISIESMFGMISSKDFDWKHMGRDVATILMYILFPATNDCISNF